MRKFNTICCLLFTVAPLALNAQTITASITGTVTDPSGASIPSAKVTATNSGTNVSFTTPANNEGIYTFPFLPVGSYSVTVESQGFKKSVVGPFRLEVNQIARVDVKLEIGEATQTVEVKDVAPVLQTESTSTGDSISSAKLTSLP